MKFLFGLLLVIIGVVLGVPKQNERKIKGFTVETHVGRACEAGEQTEEDVRASIKAVQQTEFIRRIIHTGINKVPPLDPFKRESLPVIVLDGPESKYKGHVYLNNVEVTGAENFSVVDMKVFLSSHRLDYDLTIPEIHGEGDFSAVNFEYNGILFNASGHINVDLYGYKVVGSACIMYPGLMTSKHYNMKGLHAEISVKKGKYSTSIPVITPDEEGMMQLQQAVFDVVSKAVMHDLNNVLHEYTLEQVDVFFRP